MKKTKMLGLTLPENIHQKLKLQSVLLDTTMTKIAIKAICHWLETQSIEKCEDNKEPVAYKETKRLLAEET